MATEDKPEPQASVTVTDEELAQADKDFKEAVKLVYDEPERATMLLGKVLETRNKRYGDSAIECAETYLEYGRALFEQARSSTDVLGAQMRTAVDKHEMDRDSKAENEDPNKPSTAPRASVPSSSSGAQAAAGSSRGGEEGGEDGEEEEEDGDDDSDESDEDGEEDGEGSGNDDMGLAWEMLEYARTVYTENGGGEQHASALADVHLLLGDVSTEKEDFDVAVDEYDKCRALLTQLPKDKVLRRLAEVHFKAVNPLQLSDRLPEALEQCRAALGLLAGRKEEIMRVMDTPVEGETGDEAEAEIEKLEGELEELEAISAELKEKEDELKQAIKEHQSMKQALLSAMQKLAEVEGMPRPTSTNASRAAPTPLGPSGAGNGAAGAAAGAGGLVTGSASAAAGPVQDLGVAGRGRTRITLQPVNAPNANATGPSTAGAAQPAAGIKPVQAAAAKRSLEDLMGGGAGGGGVTTIGFGAAAGGLGGGLGGSLDVTKLDALMAKRVKRPEGPAASVPAPGAENSG